nr:membrane protein PM19L-like [Tanacetum cinerariifolium]
MAANDMRSVASLLMILNFAMYVTLLGLGGWAMNRAIDRGFIIGPGLELPAHFSPMYFPMGNAATGFFVTFSLIAGVAGAASAIAGFDFIRSWNSEGRPGAASAAVIAWALTLLSMGFAWKEIELDGRNAALV